jgi:uncharacterized membrane protein YidH (DUF202 family)
MRVLVLLGHLVNDFASLREAQRSGSTMNLLNIIQILQIGFVGLAFLLAYMAYKLLRAQSDREKPNQKILDATSRYMSFALALAGVAVVAQVAHALLERKDGVSAPAGDIAIEVKRLSNRIDGIRLTATQAAPSEPYACGGTQRTESTTLTVMAGLRDGTSCGVQNINYYKEFRLVVPN